MTTLQQFIDTKLAVAYGGKDKVKGININRHLVGSGKLNSDETEGGILDLSEYTTS